MPRFPALHNAMWPGLVGKGGPGRRLAAPAKAADGPATDVQVPDSPPARLVRALAGRVRRRRRC